MAPFQIQPAHPVVLIQPDCNSLEEAAQLIEANATETDRPLPTTETTDRIVNEGEEKAIYLQRFHCFADLLKKGIQDKLVLSRQHIAAKKASFSPAATFAAAAKRYIHSYVYLCHTPQTGTWIGGTPEILLSGQQGDWQTVALAGTQVIRGGKIPQQWDDKNWREQQLVAYYIRRQLDTLGIVPRENGPYAIRAGEVSHLKSDFHFRLSDQDKLGNLLALLHPTPAVCGLPKMEAYRFILAHEGYDRSYYSGFIGWLDPEGRSDLYVNLRCMRVEETQLHFYAGGGLLASSNAESEWQETQDKLETMKRIVL